MTDDDRRTIAFEDKGALDTFIAMSEVDEEAAEELREKVEKHGYGTPIPLPEKE